jgi:uncharacterized protein (UPF0548 family)
MAWAIAVRPEWTVVLLLLSPFVIVPLGLVLAGRAEAGPTTAVFATLAQWAPVTALGPAASFALDQGWAAAALASPWLVFTIAVAITGAGRSLSRTTVAAPGIAVDAAMAFLAVGGIWLVISRAGLNPLGYSDAIVQLTAVHFHYAGFALPIVTGFTARRLAASTRVPVAVMVGVPLTAVGIIAEGWLEWVGATTLAIAGLATAVLLVRLARRATGASRLLLTTSGFCLACGMALALGWSWSERFGWTYLNLDAMAATHGSLNALGFGLLCLIGLNALPIVTRMSTPAMSMHVGRPSGNHLERVARRAVHAQPTNAVGLLDRQLEAGFQRKTWQRSFPSGDFATASRAIQRWEGQRAAGLTLWPRCPSIEVGQTLAIVIPVGPISVSATSRIIEVVDEPDRYGFVYSTLPHHPEDGEESFIISRRDGGGVDVTVTAVWRAATLANRVCPPLTRFLQNRAIERYLDGIGTYRDSPQAVDAR